MLEYLDPLGRLLRGLKIHGRRAMFGSSWRWLYKTFRGLAPVKLNSFPISLGIYVSTVYASL